MDAVDDLTGARRGHFLLESGHHGDLWLDLDALLWRPDVVEPAAAALSVRLTSARPEVVCGPLVGGAFLARSIAAHLGVSFAYAERVPGVLDGLYRADYRLPATLAARLSGRRVAVVDDVVNAGSAVRATVAAVVAAGGTPVVLGALLRLGDATSEWAAARRLPLAALHVRPNTVWEPARCPLCAAGEPLDRPAS